MIKCSCGNTMILKFSRKGETRGSFFWRCQSYPNCLGSKPYKIPNNRVSYSHHDLSLEEVELNELSEDKRFILETEVKVQMVDILTHFITCTWAAHYTTLFEKIIIPFLDNPSVLDFVLRSDVVRDNGMRGRTGAKIYPELLNKLKHVTNQDIKSYLALEFGD